MLDRLVPEKSARRLALNVHLERRLLGVTTSYEALRLPILVFMNTPPHSHQNPSRAAGAAHF